jgi:hypothetical protein
MSAIFRPTGLNVGVWRKSSLNFTGHGRECYAAFALENNLTRHFLFLFSLREGGKQIKTFF